MGLYHGLNYSGWINAADSVVTKNQGGVTEPTHPNAAVNVPPTANSISTNYTGSPYRCFALESFYVGCEYITDPREYESESRLEAHAFISGNAGGVQGEAAVADACVISVNGYDTKGNPVGEQTFAFPAPNVENSPMVKAYLPSSYRCVRYVNIQAASSTTTPLLTAIIIDALSHINFKA